MDNKKVRIEYAADVRSVGMENRGLEVIPAEIRQAVEKANSEPEYRDGKRVLRFKQ